MMTFSEEQTREVEAFWEIARENGAALPLSELVRILSPPVSERELEGAFVSNPRLHSRFQVVSGYVLERSPGSESETLAIVEDQERNKARANRNLSIAEGFAGRLARGTLLVSLSGSNSYKSAREGDDIDFFCVTKRDSMWVFMLRSLVVTRIFKLRESGLSVCLSCIMDEDWAKKEFGERQNPIFARDALMASPFYGREVYHKLLSRASWIDAYYPSFYKLRLRETATPAGPDGRDRAGTAVVNSFLLVVLGSYIRVKSWALNRKYRREGRTRSLFTVKMGPGHYICESNRYKQLRGLYGALET